MGPLTLRYEPYPPVPAETDRLGDPIGLQGPQISIEIDAVATREALMSVIRALDRVLTVGDKERVASEHPGRTVLLADEAPAP